jgi:photosystem II stability/assembly factor-like uncharacterized protein
MEHVAIVMAQQCMSPDANVSTIRLVERYRQLSGSLRRHGTLRSIVQSTGYGVRFILAPVLVLCSTTAVNAQFEPVDAAIQALSPHSIPGFDSSLFSFTQWRNIGPLRGGRALAVSGSSSRPNEYYFGTTGGGVWKTTNGGTDWYPVSDGSFKSASVGSIGVCEANPDILYVGMGEGQFRHPINPGDGAYTSRDGGRTWRFVGLESSTGQQTIARMRVHPQHCDLVYAAVLGDPYGPNLERGIFRSQNGGGSWERILHRNDRAGASDLIFDPNDPNTIYATIWDVVRRPWGGHTGDSSGIFKSTDGGNTWTELTHNPGLPREKIGKVGITVSPADGNRVYAVVESDNGGVFRSDDGGATWTQASGHMALIVRAEYYTRIYADPHNADRLYVLNVAMYRSDDAGRTYTRMRVPHGDNHDLWIDPADPNRMIQSNDGGANVSVDGGRTWTAQTYPTAQLYHVIATADFPYHVCGSQQDNTSICVPSDGDGSYYYQVGGGESGYIAVDTRDQNVFYAGSNKGFMSRYDRRSGQARSIQVWPNSPMGLAASTSRERFQWTFPIVTSPVEPDVLYASSQHLWRTRSAGQHWERVSPDLTRAEPHTTGPAQTIVRNQNGMDVYATIFTVAPSKHDPNTIWVGSDDGLIHVTRDGGRNWTNITPGDLPPHSKISLLEASAHRPGSAYAAVIRYQMQDIAPYAFRTDDYGRTWNKIVAGLPPGDFVRAIREDPVRPGLLYAATEHGVYASVDDGTQWVSLSLNLPDVPVTDIWVHENDLLISTFGRSFYVLSDVSPLREMTSDILADNEHLFRPADAVRSKARASSGDGRTLYRRNAIPGVNSVAIHYYLRQPAHSVTVEVLDANGRVIQSHTGTPGARPRVEIRDDADEPMTGPSWGWPAPVPPPTTEAGVHRFSWDMRYPQAATFPGIIVRAGFGGPQAPPGDYRVRLTVDGRQQEQSFRIVMDPRLTDVTVADLEAQFDLARSIHARLDAATESIRLIRTMYTQMEELSERASDAKIRAAVAKLRSELAAVEAEIYVVEATNPKTINHWGVRLINKLAILLHGDVESADARPTDASRQVFQELSEQLDLRLRQLDRLLETELPALNNLLSGAGLPPIQRASPSNE